MKRSEKLFPSEDKIRSINLIVEAKGDTLITKDIFAEMMQFEEIIYQVSEFSDTRMNTFNEIVRPKNGRYFTFKDIC